MTDPQWAEYRIGITDTQWAEWQTQWQQDRERWAKTYINNPDPSCKAPSSINTIRGANKKGTK